MVALSTLAGAVDPSALRPARADEAEEQRTFSSANERRREIMRAAREKALAASGGVAAATDAAPAKSAATQAVEDANGARASASERGAATAAVAAGPVPAAAPVPRARSPPPASSTTRPRAPRRAERRSTEAQKLLKKDLGGALKTYESQTKRSNSLAPNPQAETSPAFELPFASKARRRRRRCRRLSPAARHSPLALAADAPPRLPFSPRPVSASRSWA